MLTVAPFEIRSVVTGTVRLDGGAMFGAVPKNLWKNVADVDDQNRILLATRTLIAVDRSTRRVFLVDTGCGTKWQRKQADRYAVRYDPCAIPDALRPMDLSPADVTDIVVTHLHFDHNGGLTDWFDDPGGRTTLRYPFARHWIHRQHWAHAHEPHVKDRASFLPEDFVGLAEADVLHFVDGDPPKPTPEGVEWFVSQGHTPSQLHPIFGSGRQRLLFVGDIVPTVAHLRPGWVMAYDMQPTATISEKQRIYKRCFEEGLLLAFPHDPTHAGVRIDGTPERPIVAEALNL